MAGWWRIPPVVPLLMALAGPALAADPRVAAIHASLNDLGGDGALAATITQDNLFLRFVDLNGDGREEAVGYFHGRDFCGSGGCNLSVLIELDDGTWQMASDTSVVQLPVKLGPPGKAGWRDLLCVRSGGGAPRKTVALSFDGETFPHSTSAEGVKVVSAAVFDAAEPLITGEQLGR